MYKKFLWLFLMGFFLPSFASSEMSLIDIKDRHSRCSYIDDQWNCDRTRGCYWNDRGNYCASEHDDDYRSCRDIYSPLECSNRSDCFWSTSQHRCVSNGSGDSPRRCYYIRTPRECNNTYNCHWSYAYDRCVGPDDI